MLMILYSVPWTTRTQRTGKANVPAWRRRYQYPIGLLLGALGADSKSLASWLGPPPRIDLCLFYKRTN